MNPPAVGRIEQKFLGNGSEFALKWFSRQRGNKNEFFLDKKVHDTDTYVDKQDDKQRVNEINTHGSNFRHNPGK